MALWEIMPQSVCNEQRNGMITAALNDSEMATTVSVWTPSTLCPSFTSLAEAPHNHCTIYKFVILNIIFSGFKTVE